ncbi:radical SAM superfamily protein [Immersiella caudata]|uniref:Radical SAM superfamily protein n=1 Tax=Immersiella caudata TaxID=314043 RepID=A0AA40C0G2_9PEZI|nr:radical SAM superfamily protein [Immersiella caudata]
MHLDLVIRPLTAVLRRRTAQHVPLPIQRLQTRGLHLAPPFLLEDYTPRYMTLSSRDAAMKRSAAYSHLRNCNLCPRLCGVNRYETTGMCLIGERAKVNVIAPHFGEEPCVQGHHGSGSVFFSMCNLRCVFCQNHDIAHQRNGRDLTPEELGDWYVKLQEVGNVHNINLITPEHVVPQVTLSILHARDNGLKVPIIYNTSAYDSLASLELLDGLVDIYLPDFKIWEPATSKRLLKADDYAATARESIKAMHSQVGDLCFTGDGIAKSGVLIRHLVMPGYEAEGAEIMRFLAFEVSRDCFVNIMEQYRPDAYVGRTKRGSKGDQKRYAEINRAVSNEEISTVRKAAEAAGLWRFCDPPKHDGFNL